MARAIKANAPPDKISGPPLRCGKPVWLAAGAARRSMIYAPLEGRRDVQIAIVGGGITGALIALAFASAGVSVALCEAALVGQGSTAASSALLLHEPDEGLADLGRRYGRARARRIWKLSHDAVRGLVDTIKRHRIACDLVERDAVYYATTSDSTARLRVELGLRKEAGFEQDWLTPARIRKLTGITAQGAIRTRGNAQFDPYKACLGLIKAASAAGAEIFERSAVTRIRRLGNGVRVHTRDGSVDAARVIIATGYATAQFRPLAARFRMYHTYVLATRPLRGSERGEVGLGPVMIWDAERPYHYARWTRDNRLVLGGGDRPVLPGRRRDAAFRVAARQLRSDFEQLFPALAEIGIDGAWEGLFAMTPDSLPYIGAHQRYPRHLFALGYGGNGMTFGFMAAQMLLAQWLGVDSPDHRLFRFGRFRRSRSA